ncbi:MAG: DNA mismatch repair endonuclease MutL [Deltaproteobacteria bacterium]|jgi:DNA mismatch repair protein MutL|nr:DNA mismatch repair endonuclease MutL [Deltaproteobacteria bacterium]
MASRVKLLPEKLINQIAAGEVVERPASILKELLDNSLDAGATRVDVELEAGGKKLIRVIDNGCGLNKEELFLCLERHATSKLTADSDLMNIATLGFRGEALPSIGSVARLAITSSPAPDEPGHRIRLEGGRLLNLEPVPANQGTVVEVRDLFFNVPARRKFLKSEATEKAHLLDVAQRYALSRLDIRLVLKEKGKTLLSVDSQEDIRARAAAIMGPEIAQSLRPLSYINEDLKIEGWLASPEAASRINSLLFLYVLGRPVRDRLLTKAIAQGYGRALPPGRWPAGLINVDLDPRRVDVNVHPAKTEVRFREPGEIFQALAELVAQVTRAAPNSEGARSTPPTLASAPQPLAELAGLDLDPESPTEDDSAHYHYRDSPRNLQQWLKSSGIPSNPDKPTTRSGGYSSANKSARSPGANPLAPDHVPPGAASPSSQPPWMMDADENPPAPFTNWPDASSQEPGDQPDSQPPADNSLPTPLPQPAPELERVLGQLGQSYILAQVPEGLKIIDQHAAHERIVFNRLKQTLAQRGLPSQKALFPETLELTAHQILGLGILEEGLKHLGFELEPFGGSTYVLKGFPDGLQANLAKEALLEMLAKAQNRLKNFEGGGLASVLEEMTDAWLDSLACRAAVKAGDKLSQSEMESLLKQTRLAESGGFCPHGRPAVTIITYKELEIRFGRK